MFHVVMTRTAIIIIKTTTAKRIIFLQVSENLTTTTAIKMLPN